MELVAARPVVWALRPLESAAVSVSSDDSRTLVTIAHAPLEQVTPEMLAWWYTHVSGTMTYAGGTWPRYLVWHPLDHIAYDVWPEGKVEPGTRLHLVEALARDPELMVDLHATLESVDVDGAVICKQALGSSLVRIENEFTATHGGCQYTTHLIIGDTTPHGQLLLNRFAHRLLPQPKLTAWIRHHVEEIGNLENFLPDLFAYRAPHEP
jgi:hypothetical protein